MSNPVLGKESDVYINYSRCPAVLFRKFSLLTETTAREERILADAREREDKLAACIDKFAENQRAMAAEIGQIREDIYEIKGEKKRNSGN